MRISAEAVTVVVVVMMVVTHDESDGLPMVMVNQHKLWPLALAHHIFFLCSFSHSHVGFPYWYSSVFLYPFLPPSSCDVLPRPAFSAPRVGASRRPSCLHRSATSGQNAKLKVIQITNHPHKQQQQRQQKEVHHLPWSFDILLNC